MLSACRDIDGDLQLMHRHRHPSLTRPLRARGALWLLWLLCLPLAAGAAGDGTALEELERIEAAALAHARAQHGDPGTRLRALPVDRRLRLSRCEGPLAADSHAGPGSRIAVRVSCAGPQPWRVYVRVALERPGSVVVAARHLSAGSILRREDLVTAERDLSRLPRAHAQDPRQLTGRRLRRSVRRGEVIPLAGLARALLVRNGDPVSIVSGGDGYRISMRGTALRDGVLGARVSVRNASSGRIIEGRVIERGTVQAGGGPDLAGEH